MGGELDLMGALRGESLYPIPRETVEAFAARRGLDVARGGAAALGGRAYRLVRADVLGWLSRAPAVSQGGQTYGFSEWERRALAARAARLYREAGEAAGGPAYGYRGEWL